MFLDIHPDLRKRVLLSVILAPIWGIIGVFSLLLALFKPTYLLRQYADEPVTTLVLVVYGLCMSGLCYLMLVRVPRRCRQATRILKHSVPEWVSIVLRKEVWDDSTDWHAELKSRSENPHKVERLSVSEPTWDAEEMIDKQVEGEVFRGAEVGSPIIIRVNGKYLWANI